MQPIELLFPRLRSGHQLFQRPSPQTAVFSLPLAQDPDRIQWTRVNLTHENLGIGMDYSSQNNSTPVAVIEWDARAYFQGPIDWVMDREETPGEATFVARTQVGFRYDLKTSTDLDFSGPPVSTVDGDGAWWEFGTWPMNEVRRFWRMERTEEATNEL